MKKDLTRGSVTGNLLLFSIPYLISCFLQTFYGLADLFIIGRFNDAASTTGVSVGSQLMHMITVIIAGLAMGSTVSIAGGVGSGNDSRISRSIGNTITLFAFIAVILTVILVFIRYPVLYALQAPAEAISETHIYILICFLGIPFITAYNVISSIFRGLGDTVHPLIFVFTAGVVNIILDYVFIGPLEMGAKGAALATVIAQAVSVLVSVLFLAGRNSGFRLRPADIIPERGLLKQILGVGIPIATQDGFVQIGFLVITAIANSRGVEAAAAVGIVEKIISFFFLVPSAMLSAVSAIAAQNAGAEKHARSIRTLRCAIMICLIYGAAAWALCEVFPQGLVSLFTGAESVVAAGVQYLRSYAADIFIAGIHFCFCGFFCAYELALLSFISNLASIILIRIPGAWTASVLLPETLFPMGLAAPLGSLLSAVICVIMFIILRRKRPELSSGNLIQEN